MDVSRAVRELTRNKHEHLITGYSVFSVQNKESVKRMDFIELRPFHIVVELYRKDVTDILLFMKEKTYMFSSKLSGVDYKREPGLYLFVDAQLPEIGA